MTKDEKRAYDKARYARIRADADLLERRRVQVRVAAKAYYWRDQPAAVARARQSRKNNPESVKIRKRRWWAKYRDILLAKKRAAYDAEHNRVVCRDWYQRNTDYAKRQSAAWGRANKHRLTHYANKRRAQKMASVEHHTLAQWLQLTASCSGACAYCGRTNRPLTRDHMVPLSRGGSDGIDNIAPACRSCNAAKGQKTVEEYMERITA